ncbi:nuclear pore glycoprotein p62 [Tenrec ecaudatus]|uniref:nuclear pore glycoprotein p62 n=1 Tax=Tenrec ecaudatus TaxID=94439 RepID=UPI003F59A37D
MSGFNFGGTGAPTGGFTFGTAKTATTAPATGFSFSTPSTGGFNFGTPSQPAASTPSTSLFTLSTQAPATQTPGFSFGATTTPASGTTGFSLGMNPPKLNLGTPSAPQATGTPSAFGLGSSTLGNAMASTSTSGQPAPGGFVFGSSAAATPAPTTTTSSGGFSLGGRSTAPAVAPSFSLGSLGGSVAQPSTLAGLSFLPAASAAATTTTTQSAASAPTAAATTTSTVGPSLFASIVTGPASSTVPSLSLCPPTTAATAPSTGALGFTLKGPGATSSTATVASTAAATTTTAATTFSLNLKPLAPVGLTSVVPTTGTALPSTTAPTAPSGAAASPALTYAQLESLINKWSLELEDQERHFLQQATQVNAWDRTLMENGEKITTLHREVEKVKLDQRRLDQELDFILSQQKELEDLLGPLEEAAKEQSGTVYLQHADEEREKTYKLAENIDAQLKRMAQDLKDIIEHLNTAGGPADASDPLQQICKILNAHMDSLQWVDQHSALLQRRVEEASRVCEGRRKEQERGFRITFD